jgi:hypothetical protein
MGERTGCTELIELSLHYSGWLSRGLYTHSSVRNVRIVVLGMYGLGCTDTGPDSICRMGARTGSTVTELSEDSKTT